VFALVRTSNPGAGQFQDLVCEGRPLFQHVAATVASWASENRGQCGFGNVGAVVGATHPAELATVRRILPEVLFLVPGYGAQGGAAAETAAAFRPDGHGAIVNSARGIIAAFDPAETAWEAAVEKATRATIAALAAATPMGKLVGLDAP
jgi:orotidine-5'-phosphate decarboxylase